jgi:hypothetical protein
MPSFQIKEKNYATTLATGDVFVVQTNPDTDGTVKKVSWGTLSGAINATAGGGANIAGGQSGQYLRKSSSTDNDYSWSYILAGGFSDISNSNSITPNTNLGNVLDAVNLTGSVAINAPTGSIQNGQLLQFRFQLAQTGYLQWNNVFAFGTDIVTGMIPNASGSKFEVACRYYSGDSKWRVVGLCRGF